MNDLTAILTKFLPVVVVGSLIGIFYLLDVFSVRPEVESAVPARAANEQRVAPSPVVPVATQETVQESAPLPPPTAAVTPIPATAPPTNVPPPPPAQYSPVYRAIESPPLNSSPRYLPPPGAGQTQPLASENAPSETPSELPVHEITQEDGERVDAETRETIQQPEAPSPSGGGDG